jgi:hypothetical protein
MNGKKARACNILRALWGTLAGLWEGPIAGSVRPVFRGFEARCRAPASGPMVSRIGVPHASPNATRPAGKSQPGALCVQRESAPAWAQKPSDSSFILSRAADL